MREGKRREVLVRKGKGREGKKGKGREGNRREGKEQVGEGRGEEVLR